MRTEQEIFNHVVDHLWSQGRPAKDARGNCLYRLGNLKCAVGALIPDEIYTKDMEDISVDVLASWDSEGKIKLPPEIPAYTALLLDLQLAHDYIRCNPDGTFISPELDENLAIIAARHNLFYLREQND